MKKQQLKQTLKWYGWSIVLVCVGLLGIVLPSILNWAGMPFPDSDDALSRSAACQSLGALIVLVGLINAWIMWDRKRMGHQEEVPVRFIKP